MIDGNVVFILLGIAGVASTFAGFAGVVVTFTRRARGEWLPEEHFRLTNMLVLSLGACFFAFVPLMECLFRLPEAALWTVASILQGLFCAVHFAYAMPRRKRLEQSRPWVIRKWMSAVMIIGMISAFVLQALNAVGAIVERGAGPYVVGLGLLLTISGFQFALLVLPPLSSTEQ